MRRRAAGAKVRAMRPSDTDRVLDWRDEWRRLQDVLAELPAEARRAVQELVREFEHEDSRVGDRAA